MSSPQSTSGGARVKGGLAPHTPLSTAPTIHPSGLLHLRPKTPAKHMYGALLPWAMNQGKCSSSAGMRERGVTQEKTKLTQGLLVTLLPSPVFPEKPQHSLLCQQIRCSRWYLRNGVAQVVPSVYFQLQHGQR